MRLHGCGSLLANRCSDCVLPGGSQRLAMPCPAWQRQRLLRRLDEKSWRLPVNVFRLRVDPGEMGTEAGDFNALSKAASSAQQASCLPAVTRCIASPSYGRPAKHDIILCPVCCSGISLESGIHAQKRSPSFIRGVRVHARAFSRASLTSQGKQRPAEVSMQNVQRFVLV